MVVIKATNLEFMKELCETSVFILKYDLCPIELILRETYSPVKLLIIKQSSMTNNYH